MLSSIGRRCLSTTTATTTAQADAMAMINATHSDMGTPFSGLACDGKEKVQGGGPGPTGARAGAPPTGNRSADRRETVRTDPSGHRVLGHRGPAAGQPPRSRREP
ncbi:hypothetical protein GCM10010519_78460 [Streptomyces lactacystinicus]